MSLAILSNSRAVGFGISAPFTASGGTAPYTYEVLPDGVGGSITSGGVYTAPSALGTDYIRATDSQGKTVTIKVFVGTAIHLVADIIQRQLGLTDGRVYLWDQKINMPTDSGLFIAVGVLNTKAFGMTNKYDYLSDSQVQSVNMQANVSLDVISRGPEARDRKEEVLMALSSNYAETQQNLNNFYIAKISNSFTNVSQIDGSAIPYRFNINVNIQYSVRKQTPSEYYDDFQNGVDVVTDQ